MTSPVAAGVSYVPVAYPQPLGQDEGGPLLRLGGYRIEFNDGFCQIVAHIGRPGDRPPHESDGGYLEALVRSTGNARNAYLEKHGPAKRGK